MERWIEVDRRELLDCGIFSAHERRSKGPHGKTGRFIVLDAPDWAIVVPVLEQAGQRQLVTVRQYRHGSDDICAEFPGGVVEPGEAPALAAARELLEETGYRAGHLEALGSCSPNPAFMDNRLHVFLALDLELAAGQVLDEHEIVDVHLVPEDELLPMVGDAPWSHALMATAAWYYRRWLDRTALDATPTALDAVRLAKGARQKL
jgi:8-oxo-dGTP pyrophosphatase MutT (NUDIX family)